MRLSRFHLATVKEVPADAEIASHRLMLRTGMIRKLAAGIYTWSPLGLRVLTRVANVVREEMNRAGALELLMPSVQPKELWDETGRWAKFGGQLLKIKDRKEASYCYGPTHEEVITDYARNELKSYKQLAFDDVVLIAVGFVTAFVAGVVVVKIFLDYISRHGFVPFAWWRIGVGAAGLAGLLVYG